MSTTVSVCHFVVVPGHAGDRVEGARGGLALRQKIGSRHDDVDGHEGGAAKALTNLDVDDAARRAPSPVSMHTRISTRARLTIPGLVLAKRETRLKRGGREVHEALRAPGSTRGGQGAPRDARTQGAHAERADHEGPGNLREPSAQAGGGGLVDGGRDAHPSAHLAQRGVGVGHDLSFLREERAEERRAGILARRLARAMRGRRGAVAA